MFKKSALSLLPPITFSLAALAAVPARAQQFDLVDVTDRIGIDFNYADNRMGFAIGDFDGDGWQDFAVFAADDQSPSLFRNQGALIQAGQRVPWFTNVTAQRMPVNDIPTSLGAFADLDNDGDQDMVVTRRGISPTTGQPDPALCAIAYYENKISTTGRFEFGTSPLRIAHSPSTVSSLALVDHDGDADLDIFLAYSGNVGDYTHSRCFMIQNNGLPHLQDISATWGPPISTLQRALSVVFADFNGDMLPDLHCAVDFYRDFHCQNMGGGQFMDVTQSANTLNQGSDMGLAVGDFDNDLDLDIYSTNINIGVLYVNDGLGHFVDQAAARGCRNFANGFTSIGWGTNFVDLDNDQDLDLTVIPTGTGTGNFFRNDGTGQFTDVTIPTGIDLRGYSIIDFDFDKDGDQDLIAMGNGLLTSPRFYMNNTSAQTTGQNHWVVIELEGTLSNRDAIGAQVVVRTPDGVQQMRALMAGHSYRTGTPKTLHFGLGDSALISEIEVRWPSGQVARLGPLVGDRYLHLTE
ncbi:ASPIC and UnbV [Planctomycetes bacterium Poly30]|uniref:ASPIC and UnbV n=1 Tax=Saltatorellus ferox TaxID=2528018 RepID=A0A518EKK9_9BACT|nr:ASPIC and UnbV [Planctomycetes bacterium Poly30]